MKTATEPVTCHWCHSVIEHPESQNIVHVGGQGDVYACRKYLEGQDCRDPVKRFAHSPLVCRECGYTIHKETYVEVDNGIYGVKAYHIKCQLQESEIIEDELPDIRDLDMIDPLELK